MPCDVAALSEMRCGSWPQARGSVVVGRHAEARAGLRPVALAVQTNGKDTDLHGRDNPRRIRFSHELGARI